MTKKNRGFEVVSNDMRKNTYSKPEPHALIPHQKGNNTIFLQEVQLPTRADVRSAGYDFYSPVEIQIMPGQKVIIFTDVKAYMQDDEQLKLFIRSSLATKQGLVLTNQTGIVDASYYNNPDNEGNIGICIKNTSPVAVTVKRGDRIAQGIFEKYLTADNDATLSADRAGGFGSSGQ